MVLVVANKFFYRLQDNYLHWCGVDDDHIIR